MSAKPGTPITRKEMYLDVMTGGSSNLPEPAAIEEKYLAKIAGMTVDLPTPIFIKHKYLAKIAGMTVNVPTYTTNLPRIYAYLAKAAGQDVEVPQPITREEMYWFDYVGGQPTPSEQEYTGAVPVTFTANGQPLLDYLISGNTVQSGTPTPGSPIMPQGTGERAGNLFDYKTAYASYINADGDVAATTLGKIANSLADFVGQTVTIRVYCKMVTATRVYVTSIIGNTQKTSNSIYQGNTGYMTLIVTPETADDYWKVSYGSLGTGNNVYSEFMLNSGSTPLPYEPYGCKIPITSAGHTSNIYLGEVESTRRIKKLVFDGTENWRLYSLSSATNVERFYLVVSKNCISPGSIISSHFPTLKDNSDIEHTRFGGSPINEVYIYISRTVATNAAELKSYLAQQYANGTPVTMWYVLATEETAVVNEPLMKIGDYADTLSKEQAGVEIPTVNGSNTLDVLTTVKPSKVYIKYKGEPVAGSQTSSQSSVYAPAEVSGQSESVDDINSSLLGKEEETE